MAWFEPWQRRVLLVAPHWHDVRESVAADRATRVATLVADCYDQGGHNPLGKAVETSTNANPSV